MTIRRGLLLLLAVSHLTACGEGSEDDLMPPDPDPAPTTDTLWGTDAVGGEGCQEIVVPDLAVASLEAAFAVPGCKTIRYAGPLGNVDLENRQIRFDGVKDVTLDCGGWVNFVHGTFFFVGAENFIIRDCRFRDSPARGGQAGDAIRCTDCQQVWFDHISAAWATDEAIDVHCTQKPCGDVALTCSIVAEVLWTSTHPESPGHAFCVRGGGVSSQPETAEGPDRFLVAGNVIAGCSRRQPHGAFPGSMAAVGNTVYHCGYEGRPCAESKGGMTSVFVGEQYLRGPESAAESFRPIEADDPGVYADAITLDGIAVSATDAVDGPVLAAPPFPLPSVPACGGAVGARPLDPTDRRILADVANATGTIGAKDRRELDPVPPPDTEPN